MDVRKKLGILADAAKDDASYASSGGKRKSTPGGLGIETPWAKAWMATFHPSALLRMPDERSRAEARAHFEEDLRRVVDTLRALPVTTGR